RCERPPAGAGVAVSCASAATRRQRASSTLAVAMLLLAVVAALGAPRPVEAAEPLDTTCRVIRDLALDSSVTLGVVVVDLQSGDRCALNESRPFRTASLYKTVVAAELYRQVAEGLVSL